MTEYTPALGYRALTPLYDGAIALLTRERTWRKQFVSQIDPQPGDRILDLGCGTGSLSILLAAREPKASIAGLDPDPDVLRLAAQKAAHAGVHVEFVQGFLDELGARGMQAPTKIVSSLVFHQVEADQKLRMLRTCRGLVVPSGSLHIADYGLQRGAMKYLFRNTVQRLDGFDNTQFNAEGRLSSAMIEAGFGHVVETSSVMTLTGRISLWVARVAPEPA